MASAGAARRMAVAAPWPYAVRQKHAAGAATARGEGGWVSGAQLQHPSRWRAVFTALRDVGMTALALWGIWHQEHTGHVQPYLLLTYVVVLGLIPAGHALALLRAPSSPDSPGTASAPDTAPMLR